MTIKFPTRYKYTGENFSGGMGNVFICEDENLKRKVAIKTIQTPSEDRRMLDEISAYEVLRSNHVVEIFDIIKFNENSYGIVQDYLPGEDLFVYAASNDISIENYIKILFQVATGLNDIHRIGKIHRDIKPNNIKFDQQRLLKIFDFGLSRTIGKDAQTVGFRGTRGFAAPELFIQGKIDFTEKIDVYAFGMTALFLAEKKLPSSLTKMPPEIKDDKDYFSDLSIPDIPGEILSILNGCLSFDHTSRPSMESVHNILARYLLSNKHKATVCWEGNSYILDKDHDEIDINREDIGRIKIKYDGLTFKIMKADGEVFINNRSVQKREILPGSCVVTIGNTERRLRKYVTFDASYPEVIL